MTNGLRFETQAGCRVSLLCTRHPTIRDVARLASVSIATVSRTLNDPGQVKPDTRERVLLAISELGYSPNLQARDLALGRSSLSSRNRQESTLGDHLKAAIDDQVKSGHSEKA